MGYYVSLKHSNVKLPKESERLAYEAMLRLDETAHHLKNGGSYSASGKARSWFSWMPEDLKELKSIKEFFEQLGFMYRETDDAYEITGYDSKSGQEDLFFWAIAPYLRPIDADWPADMEWQGEDGSQWTWTFTGGEMNTAAALVQWDDNGVFTPTGLTR